MKTKSELREEHGTPEEFERAVWRAFTNLYITSQEAEEAIAKYREEYNAAPESRTSWVQGNNIVEEN